MSSNVDRILKAIDAGLQTPMPDPTFGEQAPINHGRCARCETNPPAKDGDLCSGCRAFLLGDADVDPMMTRVPPPVAGCTGEDESCEICRRLEQLRQELSRGLIDEVYIFQNSGGRLNVRRDLLAEPIAITSTAAIGRAVANAHAAGELVMDGADLQLIARSGEAFRRYLLTDFES
jgi:hypothetical protein